MAGLGRKVFNAGEVLSAANVQGYLQDQVVQVYSGTAARSSALGTAVSEGMTSYLTDSNELSVYTVNGTAAWSPVNLSQSPNVIINGAFDFWQRGTSFTVGASAGYTADRFYGAVDGSGVLTFSRQTFTPGTAPVAGYEGQYFFRSAKTAGTTNTYGGLPTTRVEDVRTFAGQTVTWSFWAKADANITINAYATQSFGSGGSTAADAVNTTVSLTTSWARQTISFNMPSVSGKTIGTSSFIELGLYKTQAAAYTIDLWGVQLEAGSVATPFRRNAPSLQGELAACQRYYWRSTVDAAYGYLATTSIGRGTMDCAGYLLNPVPMRTKASAIDYSNVRIWDGTTGITINTITGSTNSSPLVTQIDMVASSGITQYRPYVIQANNNAAAYLGFSAEL